MAEQKIPRTWWPSSSGGGAALAVLMALAFILPLSRNQERDAEVFAMLSGLVSAGIWYGIVVFIRFFAVVSPARMVAKALRDASGIAKPSPEHPELLVPEPASMGSSPQRQ